MLNNIMVATEVAEPNAVEFGSEVVDTFVETFGTLGGGIAETAVDVFNKVFVSATGGPSNIAIWGIVFLAAGLVIGLVRKFTNKAS